MSNVFTKAEKAKKTKARNWPYKRFNRTQETNFNNTNRTDGRNNTKYRPGVCFNCGNTGHWKAECKQNTASNNEISTFNASKFCWNNKFDICQKESKKSTLEMKSNTGKCIPIESTVGCLKQRIQAWRQITDDTLLIQ
ncbi:hypothetical protein ACF0H5_009486 [Mactra antiquata]